MGAGISRSKEFEKKGLTQFGLNVGVKCGHDCTYCSTGAMLRNHKAFEEAGEDPFGFGFAIIDPDKPKKVAKEAACKRKRGVVQLCTTVDAWDPAAQEHNLGRRCLEGVLAQPGWTVRILTKNAAVVEDFDIVKRHQDRVLIGLSLTGTTAKQEMIQQVEPKASTISERMEALKKAHQMGLRTYGMLCPLLPGVSDGYDDVLELIEFVKSCRAEQVFAEAVNPRGKGLILTAEALRTAGFVSEAEAVDAVRHRPTHSAYTRQLIGHLQRAMRKHRIIRKLRFLLYPSGLTETDKSAIRKDDTGVVWL
jgi:DNA repair photolyase